METIVVITSRYHKLYHQVIGAQRESPDALTPNLLVR